MPKRGQTKATTNLQTHAQTQMHVEEIDDIHTHMAETQEAEKQTQTPKTHT